MLFNDWIIECLLEKNWEQNFFKSPTEMNSLTDILLLLTALFTYHSYWLSCIYESRFPFRSPSFYTAILKSMMCLSSASWVSVSTQINTHSPCCSCLMFAFIRSFRFDAVHGWCADEEEKLAVGLPESHLTGRHTDFTVAVSMDVWGTVN